MEEKKAAMVEALIQKEQEYKLLLEEATEICNANMASIEANLPLLLDMVKNSDK